MSANYTYPGGPMVHTLTALKGWYRDSALDVEVKLSSNVNIGSTGAPAHSGVCVHPSAVTARVEPYGGVMDGPPTVVVEMGCGAGHGMPLWLWPGSNEPDIYNPGVTSGSAAGTGNIPPDFISVLPPATSGSGLMPALVATGAYELETTEFDGDQTYAVNNFLRVVTSNTAATAGHHTNQLGTTAFGSGGAAVWGDPGVATWDTVVGVVSRGKYTPANRYPVIGFWPKWLPGNRA